MTRIVQLRLGDIGEPSTTGGHGVLSFPALPPQETFDTEKGLSPLFCLRFYIEAGSTITNEGTIWTDVQPDGHTEYKRGKFYGHRIKSRFDRDTIVDINIYTPGAFSYYLSYHDEGKLETTRRFHFVVPPSLFINGEFLPLNSVTMQSVVSKWVGSSPSDWKSLFEEIHRKNYNMIHFTPLQVRGESNSPYSICDQLDFDRHEFPNGREDVQAMIADLEKEYGILSMTDVVFNHTANNSPWLREHPESGYNQETAPHLQAAMLLDELLLHFSRYMSWHGCPTVIRNTGDLLKVMDGIKIHVLGDLRLWQFYVVNVKEHLKELRMVWNERSNRKADDISRLPLGTNTPLKEIAKYVTEKCSKKPFGLGSRFENSLDIEKFVGVLRKVCGDDVYFGNSYEPIESKAREIIDEVNLPLYKEYDQDNEEILENLYNRINYQRLDPSGPLMGEVTKDSPLTEPYFTRFSDSNGRKWALANNGWIWGGNPLVDFASSKSKCYLRREVIVWGDCVKLRYGRSPDDSPYLWARMKKYAEMSAQVFHGFRIDNCHSTPIHVGEYLLDAARAVRPNLYVVAELFTGSEDLDIYFAERLGISSLIREAMQAYSVGELSRLVHRHGGKPIGSFRWLPIDTVSYPAEPAEFSKRNGEELNARSEIPVPELVTFAQPHALFMDCTHDNETPFDKRTVEDTLPNSALVAFCSCATGTTMGYDECYPHLLDLVNEKRHYKYGPGLGIGDVKARLNKLRHVFSEETVDDLEANEMHVHHEGQFITVHRFNAKTGKGCFLVARTKFLDGEGEQKLEPILLSGTSVKNLFGYTLQRKEKSTKDGSVSPRSFGIQNSEIGKIETVDVELKSLQPAVCTFDHEKNATTVVLPDYFPQGSIIVLSTEIPNCNVELDEYVRTGALEAAGNLCLADINSIMYRCESEERDASGGVDGVYDIPNYGHLVYAGIQGWISVLRNVVANNDLAHPIAEHLRQGTWALDYIPQRIAKYELTTDQHNNPNRSKAIRQFRLWIEQRFERVKKLPSFMVPRFFSLAISVAYEALRYRALSLMPKPIQKASTFIQSLSLVSVQMVGESRSASLSPLGSDLDNLTLAAGLPHFSYDFMRCWGRDVFISLRGLLLATGRFAVARTHILCFAMTLKHGLIPNLLGSGKEPRYNARDAVWFFLQAIQDFYNTAPKEEVDKLFSTPIRRRFLPWNDEWFSWEDKRAFSKTSYLSDVIYEILACHAKGIHYREAHAGTQIDSQMRDPGFNIDIQVDWKTGLVFGGNQYNCGTWMDKMGESARAGSKGIPGTPRDGADVEINGLLKSALRFVIQLHNSGMFSYTEVKTQKGDVITFSQWNNLLQSNFERCFYIPEDPEDDNQFVVNPSIVNRRGIYKDIVGSGKPYENYQLRGNFPIAIMVAPELFTPERALKALLLADRILKGPVGLRTLDPSDLNYRPYYNNSEDSDNFATSKGRNYHQGPEWVWIYGYFLRALRLMYKTVGNRLGNDDDGKKQSILTSFEPSCSLDRILSERLSGNVKWLKSNDWAGLAELTNKDGAFCNDSSPTQAWSASCLLDLYLDFWNDDNIN